MSSSEAFPPPQLPWPKNELSKKGISEETIEYHYGKHHLGYVRKLNQVAANDNKLAKCSIEDIIMNYDGLVFNLAAQIWNHNFYWEGMSSGSENAPSGQLAEQINKDFNSFEDFKTQFTTVANNHFGSGWVWLVWNDSKRKLEVFEGHDADNPIRHKMTPILTLDVWEHAYYIDYKSDRPAYVNAWWNCVDWERVGRRFHPDKK